MSTTSAVNDFDVAELLCRVCGIDPDSEHVDAYRDSDQLALDRYGIDLDVLTRIVSDLLPFCAEGISALGGKRYKGFAHDGAFIVKQEVD